MFADFSSVSQSHLQPQRGCREVLTDLFSEAEGLYGFSSRSHSKFQSTLKSEPMNHSQLPVVLNVSRLYLSGKYHHNIPCCVLKRRGCFLNLFTKCLFCGLDGIESTLQMGQELALSASVQTQTFALFLILFFLALFFHWKREVYQFSKAYILIPSMEIKFKQIFGNT